MELHTASPSEHSLFHEGILYYTLVDEEKSVNLGVCDQKVVADDSVTYVGYYKSHALVFSEQNLHLSINGEGKLESSQHPFPGFKLESDPSTRWSLYVSYNGNTEFQLYADTSIGYMCQKPGARKITLHYEIDWPLPI